MAIAPAAQRPLHVQPLHTLGIFSAIVALIFAWLPVAAQPPPHPPQRRQRILHDDPIDFTDPEFRPFIESLTVDPTSPIIDTRMPPAQHRQLQEALEKESWTQDRDVRINAGTNSISIFNKPFAQDEFPVDFARPPVPLSYQGVPVVSHSYPLVPDPFVLPQFSVSPDVPSPIGLMSLDKITNIKDFLGHVEIIDVYLDGEVTFGIADNHFRATVHKLGHFEFEAYGYPCRLGRASQLTSVPDKTLEKLDDHDIPSDIGPGMPVYNASMESSKIGMLLAPRESLQQSPVDIYHFTVSNHSFLRKMSLAWPPTAGKIALFSILLGYVFFLAQLQFLPLTLHARFLSVRLVFGLLWSCTIFRGWIKKKDANENLGEITYKTGPLFIFDLIYFLPTILSMFVVWNVEQFVARTKVLGLPIICWVDIVVSSWVWYRIARPIDGFEAVNLVDDTVRIEYAPMARDFFTWTTRQGPFEIDSFRIPHQVIAAVGVISNIVVTAWPTTIQSIEFPTRFLAMSTFFLDLAQLVWSYDFRSTWTLIGEPIFDKWKNLAGRVVKNLDPDASRLRPHLSRNDIAIARLTSPIKLNKYVVVPWYEGEIPLGSKVVMVGKMEIGVSHYGKKQKEHIGLQALKRGLVCGLRYVYDVSFETRRTVNYQTALIWRSYSETIQGESGSCIVIVNPDHKNEVEVVAFQSHEFSDGFGSLEPPQFLKVAYRPPFELMHTYDAVCRPEIIGRVRESATKV